MNALLVSGQKTRLRKIWKICEKIICGGFSVIRIKKTPGKKYF